MSNGVTRYPGRDGQPFTGWTPTVDDRGVTWWSFLPTSLVPSLGEGTAGFLPALIITLFEGAAGVRLRMPVAVPRRLTASFGSSGDGTIEPSIMGVFSDNKKTVDLSSGEVPTQQSCWMNDMHWASHARRS